jgi:alkylation response protein AidB-like acyl-CoA dehydrogenase
MGPTPVVPPELLEQLRLNDGSGRPEGATTAAPLTKKNGPDEAWLRLRASGLLRWGVPPVWGGCEVAASAMLAAYLELARVDLTTTFVLTQRNAACQRVAASPNQRLQERLLPLLARDEIFATVGISHLTTSRQYLATSAVTARPCAGGFELDGEIPWVTGGARANLLITGGTLASGEQLLAALDTRLGGVEVAPAVELLALNGSSTGPVRLCGVRVAREDLVHEPTPQVLKQGANLTAGSLSTSALAIGHAWGAIDDLAHEARSRPELGEFVELLRAEAVALRDELLTATRPESCGGAGNVNERLRTRANSLVMRSTQVLLAASKGAGYVASHRAGRLVREALFFLVWSCPQPVVTANLRELTRRAGEAGWGETPSA